MTHPTSPLETTDPLVPREETLAEWRGAVYFEGLALWKEKDPQRRATIARQLADWSTILADLEAKEAAQAQAQNPEPQVG